MSCSDYYDLDLPPGEGECADAPRTRVGLSSGPTLHSPQGRVLLVGDWMKDVWWVGHVAGVSAEVPIPKVQIDKVLECPGGAGHVAQQLKALGVKVVCANVHGDIPYKNRLVVDGHQIARWDQHDRCEEMGEWPSQYYDVVVVSDYGKGAITPAVRRAVKALGTWMFVDSKFPEEWASFNTVFFPNDVEYQRHKQFYKEEPFVVHKLGENGIELHRTYCTYSYKSPLVNVKGTCGAGDVVLAMFTRVWLECQDMCVAAEWANKAASLAVTKPYTVGVTMQEVLDYGYGVE